MEGIPRVPMLSPEMKVPDRPLPESFGERLREYILLNYQDDPSKFAEAIRELEEMRLHMMRCSVDVESVCIMKRYYSQMLLTKKRFPMEEGDPIAVPFSWADRTLDLPTSLIHEDINFELCCVMFNIGAVHAQLGANEIRSDLDSCKAAFMHFQQASWPLAQLRDHMNCGRFQCLDFEPTLLTFYLNVMLAQAQECLLEKSMIDHRKPTVIAKLATHLSNVYRECVVHLDKSGVGELVSSSRFKGWVRLCTAKAELYAAMANYYLGHRAEEEKKMGERIAHFHRALEQIQSAQKIASKHKAQPSLKESIDFAADVISQREANARKENDFIYHERMPRGDELPQEEGVCMAKPIGFDPLDVSVGGEDLFGALLPTDVIKAVSMWSERKDNLKRELIAKVDKRNEELENYLLSLHLDQLHLDEPIDQMRLPDELLQCSASFSSRSTAFADLLDNFQRVMTFSTEAEHKLGDLTARLKQVEDEELRGDEGFKAIRQKVEELTNHHQKAASNNEELQRAIATHSENLKLLGMPLGELTRQICGEFLNAGETPEGVQLQRMLDKVDEMRKQRCKLVEEFLSELDADDIRKKALAQRELDPCKLFDSEIKKHDTNVIDQNLVAQQNILSALTEANANFADLRRQIVEGNERRALHCLTLVTAYQVFTDVSQKTNQALSFYQQLFSLIEALTKGVKHMEDAKAEKVKEKERVAMERKREAERIMAERIAAKECAETLEDFTFLRPSSGGAGIKSQPQPSYAPRVMSSGGGGSNRSSPSPVGVAPPAQMPTAGAGGRARLSDIMGTYRPGQRSNPTGAPVPVQQQQCMAHYQQQQQWPQQPITSTAASMQVSSANGHQQQQYSPAVMGSRNQQMPHYQWPQQPITSAPVQPPPQQQQSPVQWPQQPTAPPQQQMNPFLSPMGVAGGVSPWHRNLSATNPYAHAHGAFTGGGNAPASSGSSLI